LVWIYKIIFDDETIDFLNELSKELRKRVYNKLISTKENPHRYFERLAEKKDYKLRFGDY